MNVNHPSQLNHYLPGNAQLLLVRINLLLFLRGTKTPECRYHDSNLEWNGGGQPVNMTTGRRETSQINDWRPVVGCYELFWHRKNCRTGIARLLDV